MEQVKVEFFETLYEEWIDKGSFSMQEFELFTLLDEYFGFMKSEICGKCTPCRDGVIELHKLMKKFIKGKASSADLDEFEKITLNLRSSRCGIGLDMGKNLEAILDTHYDQFYDKVKSY